MSGTPRTRCKGGWHSLSSTPQRGAPHLLRTVYSHPGANCARFRAIYRAYAPSSVPGRELRSCWRGATEKRDGIVEAQHFDALIRALATAAPRRRLGQRLAALVAAGGVPLLAAPESLAKRRKKKRKKKKKKGSGTPRPTCTPDCATAACGAPDGCGGICQKGLCGTCRTCNSGSCVVSVDGSQCDNGERCTVAQCNEGQCVPVSPVQCIQPANPCRIAECNPDTGACDEKNAPNGDPCVEFCREPGTCSGGVCISSELTCVFGQECCTSGPSKGVCNGSTGDTCNSGAQCCSGVCNSTMCA